MTLAAQWEGRVMRAAHPVAYPALRMSRAPVQRIPRLGVLVRDADFARVVWSQNAGLFCMTCSNRATSGVNCGKLAPVKANLFGCLRILHKRGRHLNCHSARLATIQRKSSAAAC